MRSEHCAMIMASIYEKNKEVYINNYTVMC